MSATDVLPPTSTRVERMTDTRVNERIRAASDERVLRLEGAARADFETPLADLEQEWDIERVLQANAATLVLVGTVLGYAVNRRFLALPAAVLSFFAMHALQGWCPPVPLLRRRGIRTVREIERERYALKALRGDFDSVPQRNETDVATRTLAALAAVDAR